MRKSGYLGRIQEQKNAAVMVNHRFTRQLMIDMSLIALNDAFGFGPERLKRFTEKLQEAYDLYADRWNKDEKDTEYTRAKIDEKLRQICGEYFMPWDERYGGVK